MIKYVFKNKDQMFKGATDADPQAIGEALAEISAEHGDELHPKDVVTAAASRKHPLHRHFEWDDAKAAQAHRLSQARAVIRSIRVVDEATGKSPPAFLSVAAPSGGVAYRTAGDVQGSLELQLAVARQAERDLKAFDSRYKSLLEDLCSDLTPVRETIARRVQDLEEHEARAAA